MIDPHIRIQAEENLRRSKVFDPVKYLGAMAFIGCAFLFALFVIGHYVPVVLRYTGLIMSVYILAVSLYCCIKSKVSNRSWSVFIMILGAGLVTGSVFSLVSENVWQRVQFGFIAVFGVAASAVLILYQVLYMVFVKNRYKDTVEAACVSVDSYREVGPRSSHNVYRSEFRYTYNGQHYVSALPGYNKHYKAEIDEVRILHIDENDPNVFYDMKVIRRQSLVPLVTGAAVLILTLAATLPNLLK